MNTASARGDIPAIIRNRNGLYEGDLIHYLQVVFTKAKNLDNPYHNFRHMLHVTWLCYRACEYYLGRISPREMRNLLIAALFHDFDHRGVAGDDSVNIALAIKALNQYLLSEDRKYFDEIVAVIKATEFPHKIPAAELKLCGRILRDADVAQALEPTWLYQVIFGLAAELEKTLIEMLKIQEQFLSGLNFSTDWARKQFPVSSIKEKEQEIKELIGLIEEPTPLLK